MTKKILRVVAVALVAGLVWNVVLWGGWFGAFPGARPKVFLLGVAEEAVRPAVLEALGDRGEAVDFEERSLGLYVISAFTNLDGSLLALCGAGCAERPLPAIITRVEVMNFLFPTKDVFVDVVAFGEIDAERGTLEMTDEGMACLTSVLVAQGQRLGASGFLPCHLEMLRAQGREITQHFGFSYNVGF